MFCYQLASERAIIMVPLELEFMTQHFDLMFCLSFIIRTLSLHQGDVSWISDQPPVRL